MKKVSTLCIVFSLIVGMAYIAEAFYPGPPHHSKRPPLGPPNGRHKGRHKIPIKQMIHPGLNFLEMSQYTVMSAEIVAEMAGQPVEQTIERIKEKGLHLVMDFYAIDHATFYEKMTSKITERVDKNLKCGLISKKEHTSIIEKIAQLPKPKPTKFNNKMVVKKLQERLKKAVLEKVITQDQAEQILGNN